MHHYIKFDFDLGYGYGLPVLIEIDAPTREKLQEYFQKKYSDDDFISFDENYVTVDSIIQSAEFFGTENPIPLNFKSEYILNILLNYFEQPFKFSEIEETEPKTIHRLTPSELRVEAFIAQAKPFLEKEQADPTYNSAAALTHLGQDARLFSDIEDAITSAELFGICPECDAVMHEEGCIVCQNYESWGYKMLVERFNSIDEIHKIWNDETWIKYNKIKRLMLNGHQTLTDKQKKNKLFPEIPDYAIIGDNVYQLEELSHLELTPFRDIDSSSYFEIELTKIKDIEEINKIIKLYESNKKITHELKIAPKYFEKILSKEKTFEFRYNDRNYQVGDILNLKEYDNGGYTGRETNVKITYILQNFEGLQPDYAILSIKPI